MRDYVMHFGGVWSSRVRIVAAAVVTVTLCAGGLALATIPSPSGVIHGCYLKSGGTIRVIDNAVTTCKATETAISWSVQGPEGPEGPAGPAGPRGPSDAFFADNSVTFAAQALDSNFKDFVTVSLPVGSFVVTATAALATSSASLVGAQCIIRGTASGFLSQGIQGTMGGSPNNFQEITLTTAFTLDAADTVSLACRGSDLINSQPSAIAAVQVATLTDQSD